MSIAKKPTDQFCHDQWLSEEDLVLARLVEQRLQAQYFPAFYDLEIDVYDGVVTMSGKVSTYYEKQVAIATCHQVAGNRALVDQVEVKLARQLNVT